MLWIKHNRPQVEEHLMKKGRWKFFSPIIYAQYTITLPLILNNINGDLLDIGCGKMPFRQEIMPKVLHYDGLDIKPYADQVKFVGDAENMSMISDHSYDSAICLEVLEHVKDPLKVLIEINRILKPGGSLILSVPHLSRLHDIPHDYFRYTSYGISSLLVKAGFNILETKIKGGLLTFIGHQWTTAIITLVFGTPILQNIVFWLNKWLIVQICPKLDSLIDANGLFACGYAILAKKE
jgi:SAM-dependent methyltransferase